MQTIRNAQEQAPEISLASNAVTDNPTLNTILTYAAEAFDGHGAVRDGVLGALRAMASHWDKRLAEGHSARIIDEDVDSLVDSLQQMRLKIGDMGMQTNIQEFRPYVTATVYPAKNERRSVQFNAAHWLQLASEEEIYKLADNQWKLPYGAISLGFQAQFVFAALATIVEDEGHDDLMISVNASEAKLWLALHRQEMRARLWARENNLTVIPAHEDPTCYVWVINGVVRSPMSYPSRTVAYLGAWRYRLKD